MCDSIDLSSLVDARYCFNKSRISNNKDLYHCLNSCQYFMIDELPYMVYAYIDKRNCCYKVVKKFKQLKQYDQLKILAQGKNNNILNVCKYASVNGILPLVKYLSSKHSAKVQPYIYVFESVQNDHLHIVEYICENTLDTCIQKHINKILNNCICYNGYECFKYLFNKYSSYDTFEINNYKIDIFKIIAKENNYDFFKFLIKKKIMMFLPYTYGGIIQN